MRFPRPLVAIRGLLLRENGREGWGREPPPKKKIKMSRINTVVAYHQRISTIKKDVSLIPFTSAIPRQ